MDIVSASLMAGSAGFLCSLIYYLFFTDCDLSLAYYKKFGRPISELAGKVIWVTGASSGLGEQLAYQLAHIGAKLILSARSENLLNEVKKQCLAQSKLNEDDILVAPMDVCKFDTHKKIVKDVLAHFGRIDILVNNAGRYQIGNIANTDLEVDKEIFDTNFFGTVSITKAVLKHFLEVKKGYIVVISSVAGKFGFPASGSYIATKHALQGYYEGLRTEHLQDNIDITLVCPGIFHSDIFSRTLSNKTGQMFQVKETTYSETAIMSSYRCAQLTLVAMANRPLEAWIANQPMLLMVLIAQYLPGFFKQVIIPFIYTQRRIKTIEKGMWPKDLPNWKPLLQ